MTLCINGSVTLLPSLSMASSHGSLLDAIECTSVALLTFRRELLLTADNSECMSILMEVK